MKNQIEKKILKVMKKIPVAMHFIMAALIVMMLAVAGCNKDDDDNNNNNNNNNGSLNTVDRDFMARVSEANKAEIAAGQTAASKGTDSGVRSFGQFMVTEHTTARPASIHYQLH
jgi:predicted outer membrane protein